MDRCPGPEVYHFMDRCPGPEVYHFMDRCPGPEVYQFIVWTGVLDRRFITLCRCSGLKAYHFIVDQWKHTART